MRRNQQPPEPERIGPIHQFLVAYAMHRHGLGRIDAEDLMHQVWEEYKTDPPATETAAVMLRAIDRAVHPASPWPKLNLVRPDPSYPNLRDLFWRRR